jgi:uncharacterized membrane protein
VGDHLARDAGGTLRLAVPGRRFAEILSITVGLVRRYGAAEPSVVQALLRLLTTCAVRVGHDPGRWNAIEEQARLVVADAERSEPNPADLAAVRAWAADVAAVLAGLRSGRSTGVGSPSARSGA